MNILAKFAPIIMGLSLAACSPPQTVLPPQADATTQATATTRPSTAPEAMQTENGILIGAKDRRFNILLPQGFPMPGLQQRQDGETQMNVYMSKKDDKRVAMFGWNVDPGLTDASAENLLLTAVTQAVRQMEGRATEYQQLQLDGSKGARVYVATGRGDQTTVGRYDYWAIPPYLFQIGYITPDAKELDSEPIKGYFDSFRFGRERASLATSQPAEIQVVY